VLFDCRKGTKHLILAFVMAAMLVGGAFAQAPGAPQGVPAPGPDAPDAVYEAVIRYQIKTWDLGASTYCIKVEGKDADKKFLQRLKPLPVKPESDCTQRHNKNTYTTTVIDKDTKKRSVIFGVGAILWRSQTEAEVQGAYLCGSQCMSGGIYHVIRNGGQWQVTKYDARI
jgi:hypothetical protein